MPIDTERYKQDPRTPQELAKAILNHVVTPREDGMPYSITFREQLLMDYDAVSAPSALRTHRGRLIWPLKGIHSRVVGDKRTVKGCGAQKGCVLGFAGEWPEDQTNCE